DDLVAEHRKRGLTPESPTIRGTAQNPDTYFQGREGVNKYYEKVPEIVQKEMDKLAKITGRQYHIFDYYGAKDADKVIIIMGSGADKHEVCYDVVTRPSFQQRKKAFLEELRSSGNKYKRYTGTPLRYAGGKTLAVGYIVELLPNKLKRVISPFFGGGSFEIACAKELGLEIKGFDIFELLVNYWQHQFAKPEKMYKYL
ncbi:DNA adenine methylase, partial [Treponema sp. R6D11]